MWHTKLQIAIIEKNVQEIDMLVSQMPTFETQEQMESAASLIKEALKVLQQMKNETGETLQKLRQHKDFLASTQNQAPNTLDIIS
ncbi:hypothetical protein [Sulfurimonas sp.]|uniref:hypothetical protein n=1 Tax=Sulfurimonas sp. TaxID=2022749 RepID=UPI00262F57A5|nr:hypothetical protein [Sulfurimonas sp.]